MSRFLKKLTHKYEFLKLELEETVEESEGYSQKWAQLFGRYFAEKESEFWVNEDTGELRKDLPEEEKEKKSKGEEEGIYFYIWCFETLQSSAC